MDTRPDFTVRQKTLKKMLVVMGKTILCRVPYTQDYLESCNFLEYQARIKMIAFFY